MPIGESPNGELYFVTKDGTKWSSLGTVTDMEIRTAPGCDPEANITTILSEPIEFSAVLGFSAAIDTKELLRRCMNKKEKKHMKMSEKMALRLHLMMWGDMQKELGDNPTDSQRREFKKEWCEENFPDTVIDSSCWLCEYVVRETKYHDCRKCPIVWGSYNGPTCQCNLGSSHNVNYQTSPISDILALPARNPELQCVVDWFNAKGEYVDKIRNDSYLKGRTDADKGWDKFKERLADESGIEATEGVVRHAEALRKQGYEQAAKDFAEQLDAAFKRGLDEAMEKILKGEIQSDTSKKLEQKGYNKACEDICKEAGVQTSYTTYGIVARIKEVGWSECKRHIIDVGHITGADYKDFTSDILARYKNQVIEEYKKKGAQQSIFDKLYADAKAELAKSSGLPEADAITDHIASIQNKAVEEYFKKTPGARLATMDVDQAFKQYADEQKAPIFKALAEASGLSSVNKSVKAHISEIRDKAKRDGRIEKAYEIFELMSQYSGISKNNRSVYDHAMAIREKASSETSEKLNDAVSALCLYQSALSYASDLPTSAPIATHITQIRKYAFSDGQDHERERIMGKIGEMLNDKSTGKAAD